MEKGKIKVLFPDDIETMVISKNDYDRLYGDMTLESIELKEEIERLNNIIKEVREYFENHTFNYDDLMLIKPSDVFEILEGGKDIKL